MKGLTVPVYSFFCFAGEILIGRLKKVASQPDNPIEFVHCFHRTTTM